jgi:hypothetical protein
MGTSAMAVTAMELVAVLFPGFGSVVPTGTCAVAVLTTVPVTLTLPAIGGHELRWPLNEYGT